MTLKTAANELQAIRNNLASMCPDENLMERCDAIGRWLSVNAKPTGAGAACLKEAHELAHKIECR